MSNGDKPPAGGRGALTCLGIASIFVALFFWITAATFGQGFPAISGALFLLSAVLLLIRPKE